MNRSQKTLLAAAITLATTQSFAAGFQLNSQSATGIGRAFSGEAAIGDNASILARNPAGMALFDNRAFSGGVTYADADVSIENVRLEGIGSWGSENDAGDSKFIPNLFYIHRINEKMSVGAGAFSNFGTGTDATSLSNELLGTIPAPTDLVGNTEVTTINFNVSLSYEVNDQLAVGAGIDAIYGEGTLTRTSDLDPALANLVDVQKPDGWGIGAIVGALYQMDDNSRFGISYRFSPTIEVEGDINTITPTAGAESWDKLEVPLPDIFQFAGFHQLNDKFAVHYTAQWTEWSVFDQITLKGSSNALSPDRPLKVYEWQDSWLFSLGGTYTLDDEWTIRAGYLRDEGVSGSRTSLSIPDSDRDWYTAGLSYKLSPKSTIDFGLAFIIGEDVDIEEGSAVLAALGVGADPRTTTIMEDGLPKVVVSGVTRTDATYYSLQYSYEF